MFSDDKLTIQDVKDYSLDGIYYAEINHRGNLWRLGSLSPTWREDVGTLAANPDHAALDALAARDTWLMPARKTPPLAVMCCGLGSAWPGMGRELYDNFPAARAAMDRLAGCADWDVLALMDEPALDKINQTRWQIPYLFLLEYAQWAQLLSLGLKPDLVCGHSIGELVALCLAGIYSPESAWYLFDTRAWHMSELEEKSQHKSGMLAVVGSREIVSETLAQFPDLYISNYNTARQFILSGPKDTLMEARKRLRRKHVPAIILNMHLAFHNPAMRVLRGLSVRRLNALDMHSPQIPLLSCIRASLYPDTQPEICGYIADLDENTVQWPDSVHFIQQKLPGVNFLELGPMDTLCGLVTEIDPNAKCLSADAKGRETKAMRSACARLFAMGYLSTGAIQQQKEFRANVQPHLRETPKQEQNHNTSLPHDIDQQKAAIFLKILAELCHKKPDQLTLDQDLRYDLAFRSSRFPLLLQRVEAEFGEHIDIENIFQVSTVGDLLRLFLGYPIIQAQNTLKESGAKKIPVLRRFMAELSEGKINYIPKTLDPARKPAISQGSVFILAVFQENMLPFLWNDLATLCSQIFVPQPLKIKCKPLEAAGCEIRELSCGLEASPEEFLEALQRVPQATGIFFLAKPADKALFDKCRNYALAAGIPLYILATDQKSCQEKNTGSRLIFWDQTPETCRQASDLLALELLYGQERKIYWLAGSHAEAPLYCAASTALNFVQEDLQPPLSPRTELFQGKCQFSRYLLPELAFHGANASFTPLRQSGATCQPLNTSWLPLSSILAAALHCSLLTMPWLDVVGFSDIRIARFPAMPPGITRECQLEARLKPWLLNDGILTRMCMVNMRVRDLLPNGRRSNEYEQVADCVCHLALKSGNMPAAAIPGENEEVPITINETNFYEILAFSEFWSLLEGIKLYKNRPINNIDTLAASVRISKQIYATVNGKSCNIILQIIDAIFQAAMFILANDLPEEPLKSLLMWKCSAIGYIRFDPKIDIHDEKPQLQLRRAWQDPNLLAFDANVMNKDGKPVLTLHHFEFDRVNT